jgi:predicted nucleic acid-binding Zn ribbon protein
MKKRNEPRKIGDLLWKVLRKKGYEIPVKEQLILRNWVEIVGAQIAQQTDPVAIENKCLFVKVSNSAWKNELVYFKPEMIKNINDFAGKPVVRDIIFTQHE